MPSPCAVRFTVRQTCTISPVCRQPPLMPMCCGLARTDYPQSQALAYVQGGSGRSDVPPSARIRGQRYSALPSCNQLDRQLPPATAASLAARSQEMPVRPNIQRPCLGLATSVVSGVLEQWRVDCSRHYRADMNV